MKQFTPIFYLLLLLLPACKSKQPDCSAFKTGKFTFYGNNSGHQYIIERSDSLQIEKDLTTGTVTTLQVKWTNDCTYELRPLFSQVHVDSIPVPFQTSAVLTATITTTGKDFYIFRAQQGDSAKVIIDTLQKISE